MALNIHDEGFTISKTTLVGKVKEMNHFEFLRCYFGAKNGLPALGMATRS